MRKIVTGLCALALVAAGVLLFASAAMASGHKTDVCHKGQIINVATASVPAHEAHGDNVVGDEICGDGVDNDCNGVADDCCPCWEVGELNNVTAENQGTPSCDTVPAGPRILIQNILGSTPDAQGGFATVAGEQLLCATRDPSSVFVPVTPEEFRLCANQIRARCAEIGSPIP